MASPLPAGGSGRGQNHRWPHPRHRHGRARFSASAFEAVVSVPSLAVAVEGTVSTPVDSGDTGRQGYRHICPHCASGVAFEVEAMPG
jgi:hypothetical protein